MNNTPHVKEGQLESNNGTMEHRWKTLKVVLTIKAEEVCRVTSVVSLKKQTKWWTETEFLLTRKTDSWDEYGKEKQESYCDTQIIKNQLIISIKKVKT